MKIKNNTQILKLAKSLHKTVRVFGGAHSPSDIACCNEFMISLRKLNNLIEIDTVDATLTVEEERHSLKLMVF